jgi:hypothetical protein
MTDKIGSLFVESIPLSDESKVTKYGRMIALCEILKIKHFSIFCLLSDVYVMQKTMSKKSTRSFGTGLDFRERFSLIYSTQMFFHMFLELKNNRLIVWKSKNKYEIPVTLMNTLDVYSDDLFHNVEWQKEIAAILEEKKLSNSTNLTRLANIGT